MAEYAHPPSFCPPHPIPSHLTPMPSHLIPHSHSSPRRKSAEQRDEWSPAAHKAYLTLTRPYEREACACRALRSARYQGVLPDPAPCVVFMLCEPSTECRSLPLSTLCHVMSRRLATLRLLTRPCWAALCPLQGKQSPKEARSLILFAVRVIIRGMARQQKRSTRSARLGDPVL